MTEPIKKPAASDLSAAPCSPCWERGYNFDTGYLCTDCGGSLYIGDNGDGLIYDCDEYECAACGNHGSMTVYGDGSLSSGAFEDEENTKATHE